MGYENNLLSEWVVEGVWHSKQSLKMLQGWSTTLHCGAFKRDDHVQVLKLPPTLMKVFLHLRLSTSWILPTPLCCEKHIPIWNLLVQPNNIDKTYKRLHNVCSDMMMMGIDDYRSWRLEWHVMSWYWYAWHDRVWQCHANVPYVMFRSISCTYHVGDVLWCISCNNVL